MFRATDIRTNLLHLVGWQQHYDASELIVPSTLTESESGVYFQQMHPLMNLTNIKNIAPKFVNDSDFNTWLENKTADGIHKAISTLLSKKMADVSAKSILENKILFDGAGRITNTELNRNNLVGFEIVPLRTPGATLKINKIGLQFTEATSVTLYLMHSSSSTPIKTITCTKTKANTFEWFAQTNLLLPYSSSTNDAGGSWYLVYKQSDLQTNKAIVKDRDWSKGPCTTCSAQEYSSYLALSRYVEVHPFRIDEDWVDTTDSIKMWDVSDNVYTYETNYGINLDLTVSCDITDFIVAQKGLFTNLIALQVTCDMLREMAFNANLRLNRTGQVISKNDILYELDGDSTSPKKTGLAYKLELEYKAVDINLRGIDRICLPCANKGIKYRST